jgi:hypothetical protein
MRLLRSQMIAFDKHLKGIEAYLKPSDSTDQMRFGRNRARILIPTT